MTSRGQQAVLVLGMHRSGTSAVGGALSLLGAATPARMLPPAPDNPTGFWESTLIIGVNDRVMAAAGSRWFDCLDFDCTAFDPPARAAAMTLIEASVVKEFGDDTLLLIKDPRLCLLLDLWLPTLRRMRIAIATLLVLRHPGEVMASVAARDALPDALTTALWLRHMLAAEFASRGNPRQVLPYDVLLRDWRTALRQSGRAVAIDWPVAFDAAAERVAGLLRADLRHHRTAMPAQRRVGAPLGAWADEAYAALLALGADGADAWQLRRLDHVREAFWDWCRDHGHAWSAGLLDGHAIRAQPAFDIPPQWEIAATHLASRPSRSIGALA